MPTQETDTLLGRTLYLLKIDDRNTAELQRDTGLGYFWLRKLRNGQIKNPGVDKVERLCKHLEKRQPVAA